MVSPVCFAHLTCEAKQIQSVLCVSLCSCAGNTLRVWSGGRFLFLCEILDRERAASHGTCTPLPLTVGRLLEWNSPAFAGQVPELHTFLLITF